MCRCTNIHCSPWHTFLSLLLLFSFCTRNCGKQEQLKCYSHCWRFEEVPRRCPLSSPRTSSLHSTTSSPRSLTAMQEYFPPSKGLGLRMFRVSTPWLFCIKYFGSSPMIILFFIQIIFGWKKQDKNTINLNLIKYFVWCALHFVLIATNHEHWLASCSY